jgi:acyl-CoA thioesterase-1
VSTAPRRRLLPGARVTTDCLVQNDDLYLALGDSTGVGVGALHGGYPHRLLQRLRELRPAMRLLNLSQSGATSLDVLESQLPDALRMRPALVTLGIGINDVSHAAPEEAFTNNLEEIAVKLARLSAPVVVSNIPDLAFAPAVRALLPVAFFERRIEVLNRHLEATAARHGFSFVDLFALSRKHLEERPDFFSPDGFHPSDDGYEAWTEIVWPSVRELFEERRASGGLQ